MSIKSKLYLIIAIAVCGLVIAVAISSFGFSKTKAGIRQLTLRTAPLQMKVMELQQAGEKLSSAFIRLGLLSANDRDVNQISSQISDNLTDIKKIVSEIRALDSTAAPMDVSQFDELLRTVVSTVSQRLKSLEAMRTSSTAAAAQLKTVEEIGARAAGEVKKASVAAVSTSDQAQRLNIRLGETSDKIRMAQMRFKDLETTLAELENIKSKYKIVPVKERMKAILDGIQSIPAVRSDPSVLQDTKTVSARIAELALKEGSGLLALRAQTLANKETEGAYQGTKRDIQRLLEQIQSKLAEQADSSTLLVAKSMSDLKRSSEYRRYASQALETTSAIQINIRRLLGAVQLVMLSSGNQEIQSASAEVAAASAQLSAETDALKRSISQKGGNSVVNITGIHDALRKADLAIADVVAAKTTVAANERAMQTTIANIKKITEEQSRQGSAKVKDISGNFGDVVSSLNRTVASATTIMVLVSSLVVISIIIFAVGTAFSITRPLKMTTDAIVNIAEGDGDLTERLPATRKDELGKLSEGFNKLIGKLQGNISTLASKVDTIVSAAMDLSATSEQLSVGAREQLDQTVTLSRSSEVISRVSLNLANEAREATEFAEATKVVALSGNMVVGSAVAGIKSVSVTLTGITNSIGELAQHSLKIGEITTVIRDIADQTNLLALNAAIEAARAGEQGRGFAVVADAVRQLSEKTSSATVEIEGMIKAIQKGTDGVSASMNQGLRDVHLVVESANQAGETLKDIVDRIEKKTDMIRHMAAAAHQQSVAVDSMGDGIEAVVTVSKEFAAGSLKIAQTAGVMSQTANTLQEVVRQFRT